MKEVRYDRYIELQKDHPNLIRAAGDGLTNDGGSLFPDLAVLTLHIESPQALPDPVLLICPRPYNNRYRLGTYAAFDADDAAAPAIEEAFQ